MTDGQCNKTWSFFIVNGLHQTWSLPCAVCFWFCQVSVLLIYAKISTFGKKIVYLSQIKTGVALQPCLPIIDSTMATSFWPQDSHCGEVQLNYFLSFVEHMFLYKSPVAYCHFWFWHTFKQNFQEVQIKATLSI